MAVYLSKMAATMVGPNTGLAHLLEDVKDGCLTLTVVLNQSPLLPLNTAVLWVVSDFQRLV